MDGLARRPQRRGRDDGVSAASVRLGADCLQREVSVLPDDTPQTLADRVFEKECIAYPEAIRLFAEGRIHLDGRTVTIS